MAGQRSPGPLRRAPLQLSDEAFGSVEPESTDAIRLRKAAVCNFKKRADYIKLARSTSAVLPKTSKSGASSPTTPKSGFSSPSRQARDAFAGTSAEARRPHSAPIAARRNKTADGKASKMGEASRRQPATPATPPTQCASREDMEAEVRGQDRMEVLHRKLKLLQAGAGARDAQLAERSAELEEQVKKTKDLVLKVKQLKEELGKPSDAEKIAIVEKKEALERLMHCEKESSTQNAKISEQNQNIKCLESEVKQLRQQLEAHLEPKKGPKKNPRAVEAKIKYQK